MKMRDVPEKAFTDWWSIPHVLSGIAIGFFLGRYWVLAFLPLWIFEYWENLPSTRNWVKKFGYAGKEFKNNIKGDMFWGMLGAAIGGIFL